MKYLLGLFIIFNVNAEVPNLILVHIGKTLPDYLASCIKQIRVFNPPGQLNLFLIGNKTAFSVEHKNICSQFNIEVVYKEDLVQSNEHKIFIQNYKSRGLWLYSIERFFLIQELMSSRSLKNIFHIECDNMLYCNLFEMMPIFEDNYKGLGVIFDSNLRAILSFMYIKNQEAINALAKTFADNSNANITDMSTPRILADNYGESIIDNLPLVPHLYLENSLKNNLGEVAIHPESFSKNFEKFNSIFDAAAIGQYLGGIDPIHSNSKPGFINETAFINPSKLQYEWHVDEMNRKVPYAIYQGVKFRINNLHIHCKNLEKFRSYIL